MLVIMLHYLLFFLPYKFRIWIISLSIIAYALLVGLDASVFRAMLMGVLTLLALLFWRSNYMTRSVTLAWLVLLALKPYSLVYDLWFLLSFWALFGIIVFQKLISPYIINWKKRARSLFSEYLLANIWATLWVLPILVFFIGSINMLWCIANFFVLPIVPFVMYLWAISLVFQNTILIALVETLLGYIISVSHLVWVYGVYLNIETLWVKCIFVVSMYLMYYLLIWVFATTSE